MNLVLSLFPGIGLFDSAFELEGYCVVRGPDVLWGGDVRQFHPPAGKFDGIIGGPPCQSFSSLAHLVRASGREPKFGNLIPEFERCVFEAQVDWFVMENVRAAPEPCIEGYDTHTFMIDNSWLPGDGGDGFGQEQMRLRKFTFGRRLPAKADNLRKYIEIATFLLPDAVGTATSQPVNNSQEAKGRKPAVKTRTRTVTALGPNHLEKLAETTAKTRHEAVTGGHDKPPPKRIGNGKKQREKTVTAMQGSESKRPGSDKVYAKLCKLANACRLQGLPEDFLSDAPFTAEGKLKAVANGVPIPMGRAIAKAVREALEADA